MEESSISQEISLQAERTYYDAEKKMSFPDKRYLPRWEVQNRIAYQEEEASAMTECVSHDLSSVGICLRTKEKLPLRKKVKMIIHLSETIAFPVEGRVVWNQSSDQGNLCGILFEGITPRDQELILQFAFEVKRADLVKHWFSGWKG